MVYKTRGIENLTAVVNVRFTVKEKDQIRDSAGISGLSLSEFVRKQTLGRAVVAHHDMAVIRELRRLGGLLKHMHVQSNGLYREETRKALFMLTCHIERLANDRQKN